MKHCRYFLTALLLSFFLGLHDGNLALWKNGDTIPLCEFPYRASMFTAQDLQLLQQGITFSSKAELAGLLEDYMS